MQCNCRMKLIQIGKIIVDVNRSTAISGDEYRCDICGAVEIFNTGKEYKINVDKMRGASEKYPEIFIFKDTYGRHY